mgnify:CR=1 FL=1
MNDEVRRLFLFLVFVLVQVLVLNHIHLFGCATPLLYIYFIILFPRNYPRWALLLWAFVTGLTVDIFSNTPGMAAASLTLTAFLRPFLLNLFVTRESADNLQPGIRSLGPVKFASFSAILTLTHCLSFFTLEAFSFFHLLHWLGSVGSSFLLTFVLLYVIDNLRK